MPAEKVNSYSPSTETLNSVIDTSKESFLGICSYSISEYLSTNRPVLSAGSRVEIAGDLFYFSSDHIISTSAVTSTSECDYYIELVPSSSECSVQFSTITPSWREDYQSYYLSTGSNNRIIGQMTFTGVDYVDKKIYFTRDIMKKEHVSGLSTFTFSGGTSTTVSVPFDGNVREITSIMIKNISANELYQPIVTSYVVNSTYVVLTLAKISTLAIDATVFCSGINY